ncbi:MAG: hypothetical protein OEW21_18450, partial [Betaproteobacteria bacterium]|nr:hypothetical protein [Betaproteobacteria bacterium]
MTITVKSLSIATHEAQPARGDTQASAGADEAPAFGALFGLALLAPDGTAASPEVATAAAPGESPAGESSGSSAGGAPPDMPPMALPGLASASAPGIGLTGPSPVTAEATDDSHATRPAAAFAASGIDTLPRGAPPAGRGAVPAARDRSAEGDARAPEGALAAAEARALPGLHAALAHGPESGESAPPQPGSAGAGLAQIAPQPLAQT